MKIAVPSDDQKNVALHFGRARGFLLFAVENEIVEPEGYRPMNAAEHVCECSSAERPSRHQRVLDALAGCDVVIARGMGAHMFDDLFACGIEAALTDVGDARAAAALFAAGALPQRTEIGCGESHD
jgi:predicted Fe-Mo cluster-binding NifX family protein